MNRLNLSWNLKRFKKYKIVYDAIKNETEYASFLKNLPEDVLDLIIQQIK